jgi:hypothetical protein
VLDPTRAIKRAEPLRHNAFAAERAGVREQDFAVALKNLVHDDPGLRTAHQLGEFALALLNRRAPTVISALSASEAMSMKT